VQPTQVWTVENFEGLQYLGRYHYFSDTELPKIYRRKRDANAAVTRLTKYESYSLYKGPFHVVTWDLTKVSE
jgi:hypothetical protein